MDIDDVDQRFDRRVRAPEEFFQRDDEEPAPGTRYRAVNRFAVLSVVFGVLSVLTVLGWYFAVIPLVALGCAWRAWRQIRRVPEEMTGIKLVQVGVGATLVLWLAGSCYLLYAGRKEVPTGYAALTFEALQPARDKPAEKVSEKAKDLDGKLVYIKGYIYPTRKILGLRRFILVPTEGHCAFCTRQILPTEMIHVQTVGDLSVDYRNYMVGVGGRLRVQPEEGDLAGVLYGLEADYFRD